MNIPIKQIPGQHTAIAVTMGPSKFVIGPLPGPQRSHHTLERVRNAVIDVLVVLGWIIGLVILLAMVSPTFEGHLEHYVWYIVSGRDE